MCSTGDTRVETRVLQTIKLVDERQLCTRKCAHTLFDITHPGDDEDTRCYPASTAQSSMLTAGSFNRLNDDSRRRRRRMYVIQFMSLRVSASCAPHRPVATLQSRITRKLSF